MRKLLVVICMVIIAFFAGALVARADELDDINRQLQSLQADLKSKESSHAELTKQLNAIKSQVAGVDAAIVQKEKEVRVGEQALGRQRELMELRISSYYKNIVASPASLLTLLVSDNLSESLKNFFYKRYVVDEDRRTIVQIAGYIKDLNAKKLSLVSEKKRLAAIKEEVDKQSVALGGEIAGARQEIAALTQRQQSIISSRLASLNIPRSAGTSARGCSDDRGVDPGFSPRLAFFTYGAPHRNGLNQYGAWGRAKAGQNEETILSEYYPGKTLRKDYDQNIQIRTNTGWSGSIEDYVKRIYEVPDSWTDNNSAVLKAQAVAARSYALNVTNNGASEICTTEQCQVFKPDPKGGNWDAAIEATRGWVLTDGGNAAFTQYASTHGGYIQNLGKFDGAGGNPTNFSELNDRAYDKASPWFYCDWGARSGYNNTAWLKTSETADIVNAVLLARADSGTGEHLYQTDKPHPYGGEVWDEGRVRQELQNRGISPYSNVSGISVSADFGSGKTTSVSVSGDAGGQSFDGAEFKNWFNLRAPANIQIVGPLYNVEKQ